MTSVTIGSGVTKINNQAFSNCYVLKDVYCLAEKLRIEEWSGEGLYTHPYAFADSDPEYATLHVPAASIEAYRTTEPWCQFGNIVALTDDDPSPTCMNSLNVENRISPDATFSLDARRLSNPQRGLNIIRMSDGTTKKVIMR